MKKKKKKMKNERKKSDCDDTNYTYSHLTAANLLSYFWRWKCLWASILYACDNKLRAFSPSLLFQVDVGIVVG